MTSAARLEVVGDVAEERRRRRVDAGHRPRREPAHRLAQREHRAAHLRDLALERVDAHGVVRAGGGEDGLLDLVDIGLQGSGHLLVAVHDRVADRVDHRGRAVGEHVLPALQGDPRVVQRPVLAVPDGDDEVGADEDADLPGLDRVLGIDVRQGLEGEEQVVGVPLELGALVRRDRVLDGQLVEPEDPGDPVELGHLGLVEPDPHEVAVVGRLAPQRVQVVGLAVHRDAHSSAVQGAVDDHPARLVPVESAPWQP